MAKLKEIPIYCIDVDDMDTSELTGVKPKEELTYMTIDLEKIEAFFEDGFNTVIFIGNQEIKSSLSYKEFKELYGSIT